MRAGVLPIKQLSRAKQRLREVLSDEERISLARALANDALSLAARISDLEWWVVSDDVEILGTTAARGFTPLQDPGAGLNEALATAASAVEQRGAEAMLVLPSDIPLAVPDDIIDILDTGATSDAVVVPSFGDGGTNALYLEPPRLLEPRFGPASLDTHLRAAAEIGVRCALLDLPRVSLDIDTADDVRSFLAHDPDGGDTIAFLGPLAERFAHSEPAG